MQSLKRSILKVVAYFDLFNYPVKLDEIRSFLDRPFAERDLLFALQELQNDNVIFKLNNFYSLRYDFSLIERRIKGNGLAEKMIKKAKKIAHFLSWFPYIKGIAVSGSLSKNFAYEGCDIDFFIITSANRLWIARTFFIIFYQVAKLAGIKNWFCLNYFIDETAAEIPEKNIYTAIEIVTLMPLYGKNVFKDFQEKNSWVENYLPNYFTDHEHVIEKKPGIPKRITEMLFNNNAGEAVDNYIWHFYRRRWKKMLEKKEFAKNGFQFGSYIAVKHACKPIPHYFQGKLLMRYEEKMQSLDDVYYKNEKLTG